jgi:hypothetical protein
MNADGNTLSRAEFFPGPPMPIRTALLGVDLELQGLDPSFAVVLAVNRPAATLVAVM